MNKHVTTTTTTPATAATTTEDNQEKLIEIYQKSMYLASSLYTTAVQQETGQF